MPIAKPSLPLPPPLTALEPGTWAQSTVHVRFGKIARRAIEENQFPTDVEKKYHALIAELPNGAIRHLDEPLASDQVVWQTYVTPYLDQSWLEVPWFFAETYFYRRILEATGYYQPGPMVGFDPFQIQKRLGLAASQDAILGLRSKVDRILEEGDWHAVLSFLLLADLWGNRADLSLWPVNQEGDVGDVNQPDAFLLVDDLEKIIEIMADARISPKRVDLVVDNAGFEFVVDLILGDYLLTSGLAGEVHIHLKAHPTFVSDATCKDFDHTLAYFMGSKMGSLRVMGSRLTKALDQGRLSLHEDYFWTSPLPGWEMPVVLRESLAQASLVIFKGDANYRRLLGDLHWPFNTPFSKIFLIFLPLFAHYEP